MKSIPSDNPLTVRLSGLTETTVSTVMGTMNLEGSMRYALTTAELDEADQQGLLRELSIIIADALDLAGWLAMEWPLGLRTADRARQNDQSSARHWSSLRAQHSLAIGPWV